MFTAKKSGFVFLAVSIALGVVASLVNLPLAYGQPVWESVPIRTKPQAYAGLKGGEGMQQICGMAYAPSNPNTVYFITDTSQVWKSIDGGNTWQMKHSGFLAYGGYAIAVDPNNENVALAYGNAMVNVDAVGSAKGIYRTTNGGNTWFLVRAAKIGLSPYTRGGVNIAYASSSTIFAGSQGEGLFKSSDGGTTWLQVNLSAINGDNIYDVRVHPDDSSVIFVASATDAKLYKVFGGGSSIAQVGTGLPQHPVSMAISGNNNGNASDDIIFAAVYSHGVYKSTNSGISFNAINSGMSSALSAGARAKSISARPADPSKVYVVFDKNVYHYYTGNGGTSWQSPASMDEQNADGWVCGSLKGGNSASWGDYWGGVVSIHPSLSNTALAQGENGVVKKTTDGGATWRYSSSGYTGGRAGDAVTSSNLVPYSWDVGNQNRMIVFLMDNGPFITTDGGSTFRNLNIPRHLGAQSTLSGAIEPVSGSNVVVTAVGDWTAQQIAVTNNVDATNPTWTLISGTDDYYPFIAFNPQNTNVVYAGQYKSTNKGATWAKLSSKVVAMYQGNGNIVYSAATSGSTTIISKSTDGGANWTSPYPAIPASGNVVRQITVSPNNPDLLYVAVQGSGVYIINGGSLSLKGSAQGLTVDSFGYISTSFVTADPNTPSVLYAAGLLYLGNTNGVFRSTNSGSTWINITGNLGPEFSAWSLAVNPHNSYIYVGSSHGTWKLPPPGTSNTDAVAPSGSLSINNGAASTSSSNVNLNLSATDNVGVTAYYVANSSTPPQANSSGWVGVSSSASFSKTVSHALIAGMGIKTVYAWYKDAAGNVSSTASDTIEVLADITLSVSANKTLSPVNIDGSLAESVWSLSQTLNKTISGTNNNTTTFGVLWDNTYLYVGIKVVDSNLLNDSIDAWQDDSVEVYIDGRHEHSSTYDANDRQYVKGYNDAALLTLQNSTGVLHGTANIAGGYTVELAIPWSNLAVTPAADMSMGFDVQNNDDDNGGDRDGVLNWNNAIDANFQSTVGLGHLVLSATTVGQDAPPAAPTGLRVVQ